MVAFGQDNPSRFWQINVIIIHPVYIQTLAVTTDVCIEVWFPIDGNIGT